MTGLLGALLDGGNRGIACPDETGRAQRIDALDSFGFRGVLLSFLPYVGIGYNVENRIGRETIQVDTLDNLVKADIHIRPVALIKPVFVSLLGPLLEEGAQVGIRGPLEVNPVKLLLQGAPEVGSNPTIPRFIGPFRFQIGKRFIVDKGIVLQPLDNAENRVKGIVGAFQKPRSVSTGLRQLRYEISVAR